MTAPAPSFMPMLQKTALIECSYACRKSTWPNASGASGLPAFETCWPYSTQYPGSKNGESSLNVPASSAAAAVTVLKVEPGGYSPCVARFSSADVEPGHALGEFRMLAYPLSELILFGS